MAKITVTHEFDSFEEQEELRRLMRGSEYWSVLWDIDQELRSKLKYGDEKLFENEGVQDYLEKLREMIWDSGVAGS